MPCVCISLTDINSLRRTKIFNKNIKQSIDWINIYYKHRITYKRNKKKTIIGFIHMVYSLTPLELQETF